MSTIEDYQAQTAALAASTAATVTAVYAAYTTGQIARDVAVAVIATVINRANAAAASLADIGITQQIETLTATPAITTGVAPTDDTDRLIKAADTILDDLETDTTTGEEEDVIDDVQPDVQPEQTAGMRFERLARAEPLEIAQQASIEVMAAQPLVEGWTRQMDADPCQLCKWWWREGRIWPKKHPFQSHKGCNCQPKVVLAEHIQSTVFTRRLERDRAARSA